MNVLYMVNPTSTTVLASGQLTYNIARRQGKAIQNNGNSILLLEPGYYRVIATVSFTAADAGDVTISAQKNSINEPGITATETITTADTEVRTVTLSGVIRVMCNEGTPILTFVNDSDDIDITTSNVSITVIKC